MTTKTKKTDTLETLRTKLKAAVAVESKICTAERKIYDDADRAYNKIISAARKEASAVQRKIEQKAHPLIKKRTQARKVSDALRKAIQAEEYKEDLMPKTGEIKKVYKSARRPTNHYEKVIVTLSIPKDAKRYQDTNQNSSDSFKCRVSQAKVIGIHTKSGKKLTKAYSRHDSSYVYTVGKICKPDYGFSPASHGACASGIHFFMTKKRAMNY